MATGGIINIAAHSGTNTLRGDGAPPNERLRSRD